MSSTRCTVFRLYNESSTTQPGSSTAQLPSRPPARKQTPTTAAGSELPSLVPVWLSGNALVSVNVVSLRRARPVPDWVTGLGPVNHLGAKLGTSGNSAGAIPPLGRRNEYPTSWESKQTHNVML